MASSDVLLTGPGRDLHPRDVLARTDKSIELVAQQVETACMIGRKEWWRNVLEGVDWLAYLVQHRVDVTALEEDLRKGFGLIPEVTFRRLKLNQQGRVFSLEINLLYQGIPLIGTLFVDPAALKLGDNKAFAFTYFVKPFPTGLG